MLEVTARPAALLAAGCVAPHCDNGSGVASGVAPCLPRRCLDQTLAYLWTGALSWSFAVFFWPGAGHTRGTQYVTLVMCVYTYVHGHVMYRPTRPNTQNTPNTQSLKYPIKPTNEKISKQDREFKNVRQNSQRKKLPKFFKPVKYHICQKP